jgi:hypothetical protein
MRFRNSPALRMDPKCETSRRSPLTADAKKKVGGK